MAAHTLVCVRLLPPVVSLPTDASFFHARRSVRRAASPLYSYFSFTPFAPVTCLFVPSHHCLDATRILVHVRASIPASYPPSILVLPVVAVCCSSSHHVLASPHLPGHVSNSCTSACSTSHSLSRVAASLHLFSVPFTSALPSSTVSVSIHHTRPMSRLQHHRGHQRRAPH